MDFKVIFKDTFVVDLEQIVKRIAFHNPDAASKLGETVVRVAESLSFFPERFPKVGNGPIFGDSWPESISKCSIAFCLKQVRGNSALLGRAP